MSFVQRGIDRLLDVITDFLLTRTAVVGVLLVVIFGVSAASLPLLRFSEGLESFYDREHPRQAVLEAVEEEFVHGRWLFITAEVDDAIFSTRRLDQIRALSQALDHRAAKNEADADVEAVDDVLSLTTVKDVEGGDQYFRVVPLVPEPTPEDPAALRDIERRARQNPLIKENLVSADGKHTGVMVRLHDGLHEDTVAHLVDDVRKLLAATTKADPGLRFFMTGMPVVERDTPWITKVDTVKFTPLMLGVAALMIFISVRRLRGVILVMSAISLASVVALACFPWTGSSYNPLCSVLLPLVTIECVSFSLHYLIESGKALQKYPTQDIRRRVFRELMKPTIMCWLTTAIGFGSLVFTKTSAIREFGLVMAVALAAGGIVIPLCVAFAWGIAPPEAYVSLRGEAIGQRFTGFMSRYLIVLEKKAIPVLVLAGAISVFFIVGATRMRVGESDIAYFKPDAPVHEGALVMQQHLGGTNPIILSIRLPKQPGEESGRLVDPVELKKVEALQEFLRRECGVDRVTSVVDWIKVMNRGFLSLPPDELVIPTTRQQVAQLLLINTDSRIRESIDPDATWIRIVARTPEHHTATLQPIFTNIERYLAEHFPASQHYDAAVTGESVIFALNTENNSQTQAFGLVSSTLATLLMLVLLFRSARVGLYAIPANAFPILVTLGTMGWLGIELSVATSMISSITIGFVVDDTIHFIEHYRERIETHGNVRLAIEEAYQTKGPGTVFTGIIFTIGFAIFGLSDLVPLQHFGILAATAMFLGAIGELTIGPCLLLLTRSTLGAKPKAVDDDEVQDELHSPPLLPLGRATGRAGKTAAVHTRETTMVDVLRSRADREPERKAFGFVTDDKKEDPGGKLALTDRDVEVDISYGALDRRARAIAHMLIERGLSGRAVVLIYPPGLDYIAAIYGCFYAGALAVPAYPPDPTRLARSLPRLQTIIDDADGQAILTTSMIGFMKEPVCDLAPELGRLPWITTDVSANDGTSGSDVDDAGADLFEDQNRGGSDVAFLQYTSGSTADPKGVVLSHGNLMHNLACIRAHARLGPDVVGVSWLPPYHDMGLIGFILEPVFCGGPAVHLSPLRFLADPFSWLAAVTRHRGWISAAPNFAFDLCARKISEEQKQALDLRPWKMVLNGAEPVRAPTLHRFSRAFADCGFDPMSFRPVYGLAEASLLVGFPRVDKPTRLLRLNPHALREDRVETVSEFDPATIVVGCGAAVGGQQILVVDPVTRVPVGPGRVGELWLRGDSVARGYWKNDVATRANFHAELDLSSSDGTGKGGAVKAPVGPWLRTGDLGFLDDDSVFIAGRLKDLIVIRGRNHYPQDIELTVEQAHPGVRPGCIAAFATDVELSHEEGRLVVVAELDTKRMAALALDTKGGTKEGATAGADPASVVDAIRRAISHDHELHAQVVVLVAPGALPKTSSGKVQRRACRAAWLEGSLDVILQSEGGTSTSAPKTATLLTRELLQQLAPAAQEAQLQVHLRALVCAALSLAEDDVPLDRPLYALGLDSMAAVQLKAEIEALTGTMLPLADTLQGPSIVELVRAALGLAPAAPVVADARTAPGPGGDALVGSLRAFQEDPVNYLFSLRRRYGEVVRLRLGPWPCHLLSQPEHLRLVLKDDAANFVKSANYSNLESLVGRGLLTSEGAAWQAARKALTPGFTGEPLARFADDVVPRAVADVLQRLADRVDGAAIDTEHEMSRLALQAVARGLFDVDLGADTTASADDVLAAINDAGAFGYDDMSAYLDLPGTARRAAAERKLDAALQTLDSVVYDVVDRALAGEPPGAAVLAGLRALVETMPTEMRRRAFRDQLMTLVLAGHDTTAEALTWTLYLLAAHPAVDAEVAKEVQALETVTASSTASCPLLNAVIKESLRLYPPGWLFTRRVVADRQIGEWTLPAGSLVLISPWVTHRDPFLWPGADDFRPERFLQGSPTDGSYLPFGLGQRACIGGGMAMTELRIFMASVLRRFRFEPASADRPALASRVTLRPKDPIGLFVKARVPRSEAP